MKISTQNNEEPVFILSILLYTMSVTKDPSGPTFEEELKNVKFRNKTMAGGRALLYIIPQEAIICSNLLAIVTGITFSSIILKILNSAHPPMSIYYFTLQILYLEIPLAIICIKSLWH